MHGVNHGDAPVTRIVLAFGGAAHYRVPALCGDVIVLIDQNPDDVLQAAETFIARASSCGAAKGFEIFERCFRGPTFNPLGMGDDGAAHSGLRRIRRR
ncbi:hypothetical protein GCM10009081_25250 [Brevundimonas nasdae]